MKWLLFDIKTELQVTARTEKGFFKSYHRQVIVEFFYALYLYRTNSEQNPFFSSNFHNSK